MTISCWMNKIKKQLLLNDIFSIVFKNEQLKKISDRINNEFYFLLQVLYRGTYYRWIFYLCFTERSLFTFKAFDISS